jgi:type III restriction enzyme
MHLFEALAHHVAAWREENYRHENYPAIAEILEWVRSPDVPLFRLRAPQIRALETYWYLRLVKNTPTYSSSIQTCSLEQPSAWLPLE